MGGTCLEKQEQTNKSSNGTKSSREKPIETTQNKMGWFGQKRLGINWRRLGLERKSVG